jgi:hypothetical protein
VPAGLVYRLLERLQSHRLKVDAVRSRAEAACAACPDNVHQLAAFLRLLRSSYTDPVTQKDIDRRIVTAMIASAEASPPMLRLLTLNDAAVQARSAGLNDLLSDVTRKIGMGWARTPLVPSLDYEPYDARLWRSRKNPGCWSCSAYSTGLLLGKPFGDQVCAEQDQGDPRESFRAFAPALGDPGSGRQA